MLFAVSVTLSHLGHAVAHLDHTVANAVAHLGHAVVITISHGVFHNGKRIVRSGKLNN